MHLNAVYLGLFSVGQSFEVLFTQHDNLLLGPIFAEYQGPLGSLLYGDGGREEQTLFSAEPFQA